MLKTAIDNRIIGMMSSEVVMTLILCLPAANNYAKSAIIAAFSFFLDTSLLLDVFFKAAFSSLLPAPL